MPLLTKWVREVISQVCFPCARWEGLVEVSGLNDPMTQRFQASHWRQAECQSEGDVIGAGWSYWEWFWACSEWSVSHKLCLGWSQTSSMTDCLFIIKNNLRLFLLHPLHPRQKSKTKQRNFCHLEPKQHGFGRSVRERPFLPVASAVTLSTWRQLWPTLLRSLCTAPDAALEI